MQYQSGKLPDAEVAVVAARRLQLGRRRAISSTQVRGGTGVFTGQPAYVWISNQIGNTGVLTGFDRGPTTPTTRPFNPNPDRYKPTNVTGAPAASSSWPSPTRTSSSRRSWRSNIAVDQRLPWG